jgi:hypothetical protein
MLAGQQPPAELGKLLLETWVNFAENGIHGSPDQHLTFDVKAATAHRVERARSECQLARSDGCVPGGST